MLKLIGKYATYLFLAIGFSVANAGAYEDFFQAIARDDAPTLRALLQRGMDPNTRDEKGHVGLYLALRMPALSAAETLLAHPGLDVDAVNAGGETPLMMAALKGNVEWTRKLLDRGAKVHREGWAPVHYAATSAEPQVLQLLLERGAPVDARSPNGTTPLMMAARYGSEASVDLLLARGADRRARNQRDLDASDFARMDGRDGLAKRLAAPAR